MSSPRSFESPIAIRVEHVHKTYCRQPQYVGLKEAFLNYMGSVRYLASGQGPALTDIHFEVRRGERVGIIGGNGSGKSTILKLISGIIKPTSGRIEVHGRISPLLELGAGFHPEFTGRDNVYLNASILGLTRRQIATIYDAVVEFSEIGPFIDQPVKTYSSGMYSRLAFSIAVHVEPDILLMDEVLSVGDIGFQKKCRAKIKEFRRAGHTLVLVSHDPAAIRSICDRAIWIDHGIMRAEGAPGPVLSAYLASMGVLSETDPRETGSKVDVMARSGSV